MASDTSGDSVPGTTWIKVGVLVVVLAAAGYFALRSDGDTDQIDTPDSAAPYMCVECNTPFGLTPAGYERLSKSGGVKTITKGESRRGEVRFRCPKCEKFGGVPALVCPKDKTTFANISVKGQPNKCPKCGWLP